MGGGERFFQRFISGADKGYDLGRARGIYLTIHRRPYSSKDDSLVYATKTPLNYFDTPFVMQGKIKAKFIKKGSLDSPYGILLPEDRLNLEIIQTKSYSIRSIPMQTRMSSILSIIPSSCFMGRAHCDKYLWSYLASSYKTDRFCRLKLYLDELIAYA